MNPFFRQMCVGSGVPGNGLAALHFAQAQSPAGILLACTLPSIVSDTERGQRRLRRVQAGRLVRDRIPLDHQRSRVWTARVEHTAEHEARDGRAVRVPRRRHDDDSRCPGREPVARRCRPASRCSDPRRPLSRSAGGMLMRPPRFGTSCHIRWLLRDMSIGLTRWKVATYSTMPLALRGASLMSVMTALRRSFGSSSPKARPVSVSYGPALPKDRPSKAGDTFLSMTIFLTCASPCDGQASTAIINARISPVGPATLERRCVMAGSLYTGRFGGTSAKGGLPPTQDPLNPPSRPRVPGRLAVSRRLHRARDRGRLARDEGRLQGWRPRLLRHVRHYRGRRTSELLVVPGLGALRCRTPAPETHHG